MSAFAAHPGKPERIEIWKHEKVLSPWEKLKEISQAWYVRSHPHENELGPLNVYRMCVFIVYMCMTFDSPYYSPVVTAMSTTFSPVL